MKEINIDNLCAKFIAFDNAKRHLDFVCNPDRSSSENMIISARTQVEAARSAFSDEARYLNATIRAAEGRADARTIDAATICEMLLKVEHRLNISKKALNGVTVTIDANAQNFPSAYKYTPKSTYFEARYKNRTWRVTNIYRKETARASHGVNVNLPEYARAAVLERLTQW